MDFKKTHLGINGNFKCGLTLNKKCCSNEGKKKEEVGLTGVCLGSRKKAFGCKKKV